MSLGFTWGISLKKSAVEDGGNERRPQTPPPHEFVPALRGQVTPVCSSRGSARGPPASDRATPASPPPPSGARTAPPPATSRAPARRSTARSRSRRDRRHRG